MCDITNYRFRLRLFQSEANGFYIEVPSNQHEFGCAIIAWPTGKPFSLMNDVLHTMDDYRAVWVIAHSNETFDPEQVCANI